MQTRILVSLEVRIQGGELTEAKPKMYGFSRSCRMTPFPEAANSAWS